MSFSYQYVMKCAQFITRHTTASWVETDRGPASQREFIGVTSLRYPGSGSGIYLSASGWEIKLWFDAQTTDYRVDILKGAVDDIVADLDLVLIAG